MEGIAIKTGGPGIMVLLGRALPRLHRTYVRASRLTLAYMSVRILIADDDAAIRRLLRRLIETHQDWTVCADASDGHEAVDKAVELKPDVAVLDLAMPEMNGLQAAREISRKNPELPMLLFTVQRVSKELNHEARSAGFRGALSKNTGGEVVHAIEVLLNQQHFFEPIRSDATVW